MKLKKIISVLMVAIVASGAAGLVWIHISKRDRQLVLDDTSQLLSEPRLEQVDSAIAAAIEAAREDVRRSPQIDQPWGKLGMVLYANGYSQAATACLKRAESLNPREPRWPYFQGCILSSDDSARAVAPLRRAVDLTSGDPQTPRLRLAEMLIDRGELDQADACIQKVIQASPSDPRALLDLGRLNVARGRFDAAESALKHCLEIDRSIKSAHVLLATAYQQSGKTELAREQVDAAFHSPDDARWPDPWIAQVAALRTGKVAWVDRANHLVDEGKTGEAVDLLERIIRDYPDSVPAWLTLGRAQRMRGKFDQSESALQKAIRLSPDSVDARTLLGMVYLQIGRFDAGAACFREAVRFQPDFAQGWLLLGACLQRSGDLKGAAEAYRNTTRCEPGKVEGHLSLADVLARIGNMREAKVEANEAQRLDPSDRRAIALMARLTEPQNHAETRPATLPQQTGSSR